MLDIMDIAYFDYMEKQETKQKESTYRSPVYESRFIKEKATETPEYEEEKNYSSNTPPYI